MNVTAQRVAAARERCGLDQSALARALGVTQGAISKIEQGRTANSRLLPRIAARTGVSLEWLLGETDDPQDGAAETLTPEERESLEQLRQLRPEQREAVMQLIRTMTGRKRGATVHAPAAAHRPQEARK